MNFDYSDKENKMALDLRENEVVLSEVDFHWLSYLTSGFFMVIGAATDLPSEVLPTPGGP